MFDYSKFFTSKVYKDIYSGKKSTIFFNLLKEYCENNYIDPNITIYDFLEDVYDILKRKNNRKEYLYKNALIEKLLLGKHSFKTATIINEFRVENSKIDITLINENLIAYEIKSESDSLQRLENQIKNYQKIFKIINIITAEKHISKIKDTVPTEVGILKLSDRYQISSIREAKPYSKNLSSVSIFDACRTEEAIEILKSINIEIKNYPNTIIRSKLKDIFSELDPEIINQQACRTLIETRSLLYAEEILRFLPKSLYALAIQQKITKKEISKVQEILCTKISTALTWGK